MPTSFPAAAASPLSALKLPATVLACLLLGCSDAAAQAVPQCVSLTTLGSAVTQNFDTLSNTAGSTTNNLTLTGWFMTETGGGARDNEQYGVDTGSSTTGDTYSYGSAANTDRALGQLRSGTLIPNFGACFTNNTGSTIANLAVAYTGEQWRLGTASRTDQISFQYSTDATDLVTGTWTGVTALNFVTPDTATTGAKNGNAAADRTALSSTISSLSIANGATFWIRWADTDASGADDGLAVDDFSLTPQGAVVSPNLTINDVSLNEGNAGTTSFTFTVSLSAPAGAGGVSFDITTADNTAAQPGDYTQKSLTGQTIPQGSSTYNFTVLVNGEATPETNETFFVNVTNVTGATVTDGQGQGTITNDDAAPDLTINDVSLSEGDSGATTFTFTVSLSAPAPTGGVTFDIATADGTATQPGDYTQKSLTSQTIAAGNSSYTFDVLVNGDTTLEAAETFVVNVTNATNAIVTDSQGQGTIVNDEVSKIHDVQGNGASTPVSGSTAIVEGVVVANFQGTTKLQGFFLQEEDADADADPATSEGIFIFCSSCPTTVAEGQRVKATGVVSEFNGMTEITASTAGSVVVTSASNNLSSVTATSISLPITGDVNTFYEAREGMLVTFADTLTVSEYFELGRFGQIELYQGGRPFQFTETSTPSTSGYSAHLEALSRRKVILDDDNNSQQSYLSAANGSQAVYYPQANGGFSAGTQGTDFFRGGDVVNGLTGVLHWGFPGTGANTWRIRPSAANPVTFTTANPRPSTPPAVGGSIKAVSMNLLNYFTTIDTTSSNSSGPCAPGGTLDCRGADSTAELNRQRERASVVICGLDADIYGFMELENTTASATITDLLGAVNARCGGARPWTAISTGGTLGTDAIRVQLIYRTTVLSPVGSALVDLDAIHDRPPTAQTFDVVDAANAAFGQRFTVIANHFKSKGSNAGLPGDADAADGAGFSNATRTAQATRLLSWINSTVLPAAGDPDVLLLGDFNSYAKETPVTTITSGGYTDVEAALLGTSAYSYLFDGQLGHLDYAFASTSLFPQVTGVGAWHINADEVDLFDYNDEIRDSPGESASEEKPDGSSLTPPRVVFQAATAVRASDHDPIIIGLFGAPAVTSPTSASIGIAAATLGGNAVTDGGLAITERGVVYAATSANSDPEIGGSGVTKVTAGAGTGVFTAAVTGLTASTNYSFKAYATNSSGTGYTSVGTFATLPCPRTIALGSLFNGTRGVAYAGSVAPSGGAGPYSYSLTGSLPSGLSLTTSGTGAGDVTGTPLTTGSTSFQITVTDANACSDTTSYTILIGSPIAPGNLVIREFRLRGPAGSHDEYLEVANVTGSPLTIAATDGSSGFGLAAQNAGAVCPGGSTQLLAAIPNGKVIPVGGFVLLANNTPTTGYSLGDYGGTSAATPDATWANTDVCDGSGLALFKSSATLDLTTRLDAVGFVGSTTPYLETMGIPVPGATGSSEVVYVRETPGGFIQDTGVNANDFYLGDTAGAAFAPVTARLAAPGPQNATSELATGITFSLADPAKGATVFPNRYRVGLTATTGTYYFRWKVTNNTGAAITKLRIRVSNITTLNSPGYVAAGTQADLRLAGSTDVGITVPASVTALGLTLEAPPTGLAQKGGYNASASVALPGGTLANGASVYLNLAFAYAQAGNYSYFITGEAK